jgi:pimeloyl-ACP methyl ester carboxylesterase
MWEPQLALADGGWRVIAPDLRGFGDGASDPPATSMDDYVGDLVDLLDALHIHDAVIGGLSLGGYVAFALLRLAPHYVKGLILADTRSQGDTPEGIDGRRRMLATLHDKGVSAVAEEMLPRLLGQTTRQERPAVTGFVRELMAAQSPAAVAGALTSMMKRPDSTPRLATVRCPTLVVVGEEDALTPPASAEALQRAIAGAELVVLPRAGHLSSLETPDAFNESVARFLAHRV